MRRFGKPSSEGLVGSAARVLALLGAVMFAGCVGDSAPEGDETLDGSGGAEDGAATKKESAIQNWVGLEPMTQDRGALNQLQKVSTDVLLSRMDELGLDDDDDGLDIVSVEVDDVAVGHMKVQQTYAGVPVYGGEAIVHILPDGQFHSVSDSIYRRIHLTESAVPTLSDDEAIAKALDGYPDPDRIQRAPEAKLFVLRNRQEDRLAWRIDWMRVDDQTHESPVVFIDAHTGDVLQAFDELKEAHGNTRYNGDQTFTSKYWTGNSTYYLDDASRKAVAFAWNGSTYARVTDSDDNWTGNDLDAVSAHFALSRTVDYQRALNQSMGLAPDTSMPVGQNTTADGTTAVAMMVHVPATGGGAWNNASGANGIIWIGDGDGSTFGSFATLDILGHEFGHCIIDVTSQLVYGGEPGALNESFADIFGAMVERSVKGETSTTWLHGEDNWLGGGCGAERNMINPTACGQPDHIDGFWMDSGKGDKGGVHFNSGISNKAFTLTALGGGHSHGSSRVVQGIGADKAMRIWYRAYRWWMTSRSDFKDAMGATIGSANTDFGYNSPETQAVSLAWGLVGVNSFDNVDNGNFNQGSTSWTMAGQASITAPGVFWSGGNALSIGGSNNAMGTAVQQIRLPQGPINAQLSFNLYVDTSESTSYAYDNLMVALVDNFGNTIRMIGNYSNMNKGYVNVGPLDVSNLAGQSFKIQIIGATDYSLPTTFHLDNVNVTVTSAVAAPEAVMNGDFENAASTAWTSNSGVAAAKNTNVSYGARAAVFGGSDYASGTLKQEVITIPSSSPGILKFQLAIDTAESLYSTTAWDKLNVQVTEWGDTTPTTIKTYSNLDRSQIAWYTTKTIDLSAYRGSNINIQFTVENDGSLPTTFYVDNVSVK
ncbi:MAG: M4 family metallopeptidase [Polyangiaceae bacterium]